MKNDVEDIEIVVGVKEEEDFSFERSFDVPTLEGKKAPGKFSIKAIVKKVGRKFYVTVSVEGTIRAECHRCLDEFDMPLKANFTMIFYRGFRGEIEPETLEEDYIAITDEGEIHYNIFPRVKEAVVLEIPIKILCREDCKGLCPKCGANLNREQCSCSIEEIDPRWEALKKIVEKKDKG